MAAQTKTYATTLQDIGTAATGAQLTPPDTNSDWAVESVQAFGAGGLVLIVWSHS